MINRIVMAVVYIFAAVGVLVTAYLAFEFAFDSSDDNEVKSLPEFGISNANGLLMVANDNKYNNTNPEIRLATNASEDIVILNADSKEHDFVIDGLGVNSGILKEGKYFNTTLSTSQPGTYEYYCSLHPDDMRGRIVIQ
jgi:plastocyanin